MITPRTRIKLLSTLAAGMVMMMPDSTSAKTREPILAGSWYPSDPQELRATVTEYLDQGGPPRAAIDALIVPHAGYRFSGPTAGLGFSAARGESFERVVLLGPSHRVGFKGAALPAEDRWKTPLGETEVDRTAIERLKDRRGFQLLPDAHAEEHCLEIELPFLQVGLAPGFRIVPIVIGRLDGRLVSDLAAGIESILTDKTLIVVSSDFTHFGPSYGYVPFHQAVEVGIHRLDEGAIEAIETVSPKSFREYRERTGITVCGAEPIQVLLTLLEKRGGHFEKLGYTTSGEILGDYRNSVSYVAMVYLSDEEETSRSTAATGRMLNEQEQSFLLRLARETISAKLRGDPIPSVPLDETFASDSPLREVRGLFVTLNRNGRLRGCMGNIIGSKQLVDGVVDQALISAFEDPRFPGVRLEEMKEIEIEISVLTPLVRASGPEEIEVGRHGVLLEKNGRRAVFLPQVATEQGWDRETMLSRLCQKAGLAPGDWRKGASFELFEAQVFGEDS